MHVFNFTKKRESHKRQEVQVNLNILALHTFRVSLAVCSAHSALETARGYFRGECCTGGESRATPRVRLSLSLIH